MSSVTIGTAVLEYPDPAPCIFIIYVSFPCDAKRGCSRPNSRGPIRYATGSIQLGSNDLAGAAGYGQPWGMTRTYGNLISQKLNLGLGSCWQCDQWPLLSLSADGTTLGAVPQVSIVMGDGTAVPFLLNGEHYETAYGSKVQISYQGSTYLQTNLDGSSVTYSAVTGKFLNQTDAAGNSIDVTEWTASGTNISIVQRKTSTPAGIVTEQLTYTYDDPDSKTPLLMSVTLQRQTGAGAFANISKASYTYYTDGDPHGGSGDLKTATRSIWSESAWGDTGTDYYRYYLLSGSSSSSSSSSGGGTSSTADLLKYALNAASYDRMVADGLNPLTASDATLSMYADYYFVYDDQRRVIQETVQSGSQTYGFSYELSSFPEGYNSWTKKTTETLPDGSQNIVYSNFAGQVMLNVFQSGDDQWIDFWCYDEDARPILRAHPSAVMGYDDTVADLLSYDSGTNTFQYLRDDAGLIDVYTYHQPSGFISSQGVQEGQLGTVILQRSMEYCECGGDCGCGSSSSSSSSSLSSDGGGSSGTWLLSQAIAYPSESDPFEANTASHCYTFYGNGCAVQQHVATLPVVSVDQNGSGTANAHREYYDTYGNLTWRMDERGFITRVSYDIPTGAKTQLVQDVDTSLYPDAPAGWITPSGGGSNLVSDYEHDDLGRIIQTLGPSHSIDIDGTATTVRTATWMVYDDVNHITYEGRGYATGSAPAYTYTLINPVTITKMEADGRVDEQIQAAAASTAGSLTSIIDGAGGGAAAFPQSSYTRWTTIQYTDCCLVASQRVYHTIPTTGEGASRTNYDETDFGYDVMKRRNRTVTPGGTITDLVFEPRGLVVGAYVGTNDDGATEDDPTGGGSDPANNMVIVTGNEYDDGLDGGDGNLTEVTQYVDASTARVTAMTYDFRDRNVTTDGEVDYFQKLYYDNLNRLIKTERYDTTESGNLIARSETRFDAIGRVYQSVVYGVDPATGAVGNSLVNNTWYDQSSNVIKSLPSGSDLFVKTVYDSLGRPTNQYQGYDLDESLYVDAFTVTDDVIMQQTTTVYDANSNTIQATSRQRYHNAPDTQTGALQDPSTTPKARVTYAAMYYDGIGRLVATANYGTNGGTALSRPSTVPTSSDEILVSLTAYDSAGTVLDTTDPAGTVTRTLYDDVGRTIETIENYKSISSSSSSSSSAGGCSSSEDTNRTTLFTYTPDGQQATMTAINSSTGDQTTAWSYGTTLENSDVATSLLLHSVTYPGSVSGSDVISYTSNRQGQRTSLTDQRGCVHEYEFDLLGRPIHDRVTTVGSGVDDDVLRLSSAYDVRGLLATLTSWNNADVGSGVVVNDVQWTYNSFRQSIKTYQSHSGQVNTLTTANVQMSYADGSANTIRPMTLVYPNGRVLAYGYGTTGSITDATSQVASLVDSDVSTTHLADYSYLGLGGIVQQDSPEANLRYTLISLTGTNDPDTGDIYAGLDRFGRVKDCRWRNTSLNTDLSRVQYGYSRDSSRTWRANPTDPAQHYDWSYGYDGLQRVKYGDRGTLNGAKTEVTDQQFAQCWTLDSTGNWQGFRQDDDGNGVWDLIQSRDATPVNEITDITNSVGSAWVNPEYDSAGNMITIPQPADPTKGFTAVYDAWNRLVSLTDGTSHETVQQNAYDGRNYRVVRKDYVGGVLSETRNFYYTDGWRDIEERLGTSPDSANPDQQFVWGVRYIDDLVCRDRSVSSSLDERLYSSQDANWNVMAIVTGDGSVGERYEYEPYGRIQVLSPTFMIRDSSLPSCEITYSGYRYDSLTGLFAIRYRFYLSSLGAWICRDPMIQINLYEYVSDDPLSWVDQYGLQVGKSTPPTELQLNDFLTKNKIKRRSDWNAVPPKKDKMKLADDFDTVVIHHSGNKGECDPLQIQRLEMTKGFDDIGYHFIIDPQGNIIEARSLRYNGEHVGNANSGKIGILIAGDFQSGPYWDWYNDTPSPEQILSAANLINQLKTLYPHLSIIGGHMDFAKNVTECPGDKLYPLVKSIADDTGLKRQPPKPKPPGPTSFPNSPGGVEYPPY